jgi:hypothetical protein
LGWLPHREEWVIVYRNDPGGAARNPKHHYECWVVEHKGYVEEPTHFAPLPAAPKTENDYD